MTPDRRAEAHDVKSVRKELLIGRDQDLPISRVSMLASVHMNVIVALITGSGWSFSLRYAHA